MGARKVFGSKARPTIAALLGLVGMLFVSACDDDPLPPCPDCGGFPTFKQEDLTERWHVLNNIEFAYRERQPDVYDGLLDSDFVFYFSPSDKAEGLPESWTRVDDLDATTGLFLSNQQGDPPSDPICRSMRLDIYYERESLTWVEFHPSAYPTETWYTTTAFYTFTFEVEPNTTYIALNGARAEFVVRNNPQGGHDHWELIELHDLGDSAPPKSPQSTQEATWGAIKFLYSPSS